MVRMIHENSIRVTKDQKHEICDQSTILNIPIHPQECDKVKVTPYRIIQWIKKTPDGVNFSLWTKIEFFCKTEKRASRTFVRWNLIYKGQIWIMRYFETFHVYIKKWWWNKKLAEPRSIRIQESFSEFRMKLALQCWKLPKRNSITSEISQNIWN